MSKRDFDSCISGGTINLRRARLIPVAKLGDEVALTSVILSAIKLVDVYGFMYNEMVAGQVIKGLNFVNVSLGYAPREYIVY